MKFLSVPSFTSQIISLERETHRQNSINSFKLTRMVKKNKIKPFLIRKHCQKVHPVKGSTDSKAWPLWLGRIPLNDPRVFLNLLGLSWAIPSCQSSQRCWKLFPHLLAGGWVAMINFSGIIGEEKDGKCEDCRHVPWKKNIFDHRKQSWAVNSSPKEVLPTIGANFCSFWDESNERKGGKRGNKTRILLKKY